MAMKKLADCQVYMFVCVCAEVVVESIVLV